MATSYALEDFMSHARKNCPADFASLPSTTGLRFELQKYDDNGTIREAEMLYVGTFSYKANAPLWAFPTETKFLMFYGSTGNVLTLVTDTSHRGFSYSDHFSAQEWPRSSVGVYDRRRAYLQYVFLSTGRLNNVIQEIDQDLKANFEAACKTYANKAARQLRKDTVTQNHGDAEGFEQTTKGAPASSQAKPKIPKKNTNVLVAQSSIGPSTLKSYAAESLLAEATKLFPDAYKMISSTTHYEFRKQKIDRLFKDHEINMLRIGHHAHDPSVTLWVSCGLEIKRYSQAAGDVYVTPNAIKAIKYDVPLHKIFGENEVEVMTVQEICVRQSVFVQCVFAQAKHIDQLEAPVNVNVLSELRKACESIAYHDKQAKEARQPDTQFSKQSKQPFGKEQLNLPMRNVQCASAHLPRGTGSRSQTLERLDEGKVGQQFSARPTTPRDGQQASSQDTCFVRPLKGSVEPPKSNSSGGSLKRIRDEESTTQPSPGNKDVKRVRKRQSMAMSKLDENYNSSRAIVEDLENQLEAERARNAHAKSIHNAVEKGYNAQIVQLTRECQELKTKLDGKDEEVSMWKGKFEILENGVKGLVNPKN